MQTIKAVSARQHSSEGQKFNSLTGETKIMKERKFV